MPKLKTNRGAAKRFTATKNGHYKRNKAFHRHLKTVKSAKRRRNLRQTVVVAEADVASIKKLLPYS